MDRDGPYPFPFIRPGPPSPEVLRGSSGGSAAHWIDLRRGETYALLARPPTADEQARLRACAPAVLRDRLRWTAEIVHGIGAGAEIQDIDFTLAHADAEGRAWLDRALAEYRASGDVMELQEVLYAGEYQRIHEASAAAYRAAVQTWLVEAHAIVPIAFASGPNLDDAWSEWSDAARPRSIDVLAAFLDAHPGLLDPVVPHVVLPQVHDALVRGEHRRDPGVRRVLVRICATMMELAALASAAYDRWYPWWCSLLLRATMDDLAPEDRRATFAALGPYVELLEHLESGTDADDRLLLTYPDPVARLRALFTAVTPEQRNDLDWRLPDLARALVQFRRPEGPDRRHAGLAARLLVLAIEIAPHRTGDETFHHAAICCEWAGDRRRALELLEAGCARFSGLASASTDAPWMKRRAARLARELGDATLADALWREHEALLISNVEELHRYVRQAVIDGDIDHARRLMLRRRAQGPMNARAWQDLLDCFHAAPEEAAPLLDELLVIEAPTVNPRTTDGEETWGHPARSGRLLYRAVALLQRLGRQADAAAMVDRYIRLVGTDDRSPHFLCAWIAVARTRGQEQQLSEAVARIEHIEGRDRLHFVNMPAVFFHLACVRARAGQVEEALRLLEICKRRHDRFGLDMVNLYFDLGRALDDEALAPLRALPAFLALRDVAP